MTTDVDFGVTDVVAYSWLTTEAPMGINQYTENSMMHVNIPSASGVYMITDSRSGERYIGSSLNMRQRITQHYSKLKKGAVSSQPVYTMFKATYDELGPQGLEVVVLLMCDAHNLIMYEKLCISVLGGSANRYLRSDTTLAYSPEECKNKSERVKALWATPKYRENAIAARKGKAYAKGHKCTPEQIENRKKAARISNMKRNYGEDWKLEYARRYPEFVRDLDVY